MFTKTDRLRFRGKFQLLIGGGPHPNDQLSTLAGFSGCLKKVRFPFNRAKQLRLCCFSLELTVRRFKEWLHGCWEDAVWASAGSRTRVRVSKPTVAMEEHALSIIRRKGTRLIVIAQKGFSTAAQLAYRVQMCVGRVTTSVTTVVHVFMMGRGSIVDADSYSVGNSASWREKTSVWRKRMGNEYTSVSKMITASIRSKQTDYGVNAQ